MIKRNVWIIDAEGNYIDTPDKALTGYSDNAEDIIVIAPFDSLTAVSFGVGKFNQPNQVSQYMSLSVSEVSDYVDEAETYFQTIADWNVWKISLKATATTYISKFRSGSVYFSFRFGQVSTNSKCLTYKGTFGVDNVLPTLGQTIGDYYALEDLYYTQTVNVYQSFVLGKGMFVYWNGNYWVKVNENLILNTASYEQAVDPSFAIRSDIDEDEINYLVSFESTILDHETRIDTLEQFKTDIDNADYEFTEIRLPNDTIIRFNEAQDVVEIEYADGTTAQLSKELWAGVVNKDTVSLLNGYVVSITGVQGQTMSAIRTDCSNDDLSQKTLGVVTYDSIAVNGTGKITTFGEVNGIPIANLENTGVTYAENQFLWVGTNGKLTNVKPDKPNYQIIIAVVLKVLGNTLSIFTMPRLSPKLGDLSNVDLTGAVENDSIKLNANGVYVTDTRTTELVTANMFKDVSYTASTGILTFTLYDSTTKTIDLPLELIIQSGYYDEATNELVLVLANASEIRIPVGDLLTDLDAVNVRYSNGDSTLVAVNVKTAIDELDGKAETNASNIATHETRLDGHDTDIANLQAKDIALETKEAEQDKRLNELDEVARKIANGETSASVNDTEIIALPKNTANGQLKPQVEGMTLQATQLLSNPDFDSGITGWTGITGTASIVSGRLYNDGSNASIKQIYQNMLLDETKYYFMFDYEVISGSFGVSAGGEIIAVDNDVTVGSGTFSKIYTTTTANNGNYVITFAVNSEAYIDNQKAFNISTLIANKTYSPLYDTTFDLMSDAQIKAQMDLWVSNGTLPNDNIQSVSGNLRLNAVGKNLFDGNYDYGFLIDSNGNINPFSGVTSILHRKIRPNTIYTFSDPTFNRTQVRFEDINGDFISTTNPGLSAQKVTFTTPSNAFYISLYVANFILDDNSQLELGTVATTYEPYQNSEMFIESNTLLNRVPNGTKDTIEWRNGKLYHIQRVQEYTLQSSDIISLGVDLSEVDYSAITALSGASTWQNNVIDYKTYISGWEEKASLLNSTSGFYTYYTPSDGLIRFIFPKGTYATLAEAQADLAGTKIIYQLATPIETEVKSIGQILGSSKGTVYVEKAMRDVDMYTTQFDISNTSYPIASLIKVIKLVDGGELELDVNDATIAVDGLSFTHTGLSSGDFVYVVYAYDLDNTLYGTTRIYYYDAEDDLRFPVTQSRLGANLKPDFDFTNIGLLFPQNDPSEAIYIVAQMPHDRVVDSPLEPHVHCRLSGAGQPVIKMDYKIYNPSEEAIPSSFTTYVMNENTATWTSGTISNMIYGASPIDGTGKIDSSIMIIKLYRDDNVYVGDLLVDEFDIHYYKKV